jgi:hypothetical protein
VKLFESVAGEVDIIVIQGHRTPEEQRKAVAEGKSTTMLSKHLMDPSEAVDVAPNPLDWNNKESFRKLAAVVIRHASNLGVSIRWGGDFKVRVKGVLREYFDGPHYEIMRTRGHR